MAAPKKRVSKSKTKIRKNVWKKKANKRVNKIFSNFIFIYSETISQKNLQ